jgi:hypothetical protein
VILSVVIAGCQQLILSPSPSLSSTKYMYISFSYSLPAFLFSFRLLRSEVYQAVLEELLRPNRRTGKQCSICYSVLFCSVCSADRTDALVLHSMRFILFYCIVFDFILFSSTGTSLCVLHAVSLYSTLFSPLCSYPVVILVLSHPHPHHHTLSLFSSPLSSACSTVPHLRPFYSILLCS